MGDPRDLTDKSLAELPIVTEADVASTDYAIVIVGGEPKRITIEDLQDEIDTDT